MKTYDNYKPSGIEWIGEIPEHWGIKRLKRFAKICNGQDYKSVYDENGDYPIYGSGGEFGRANSYLHIGPSVLLGRKGTIDKPQYVNFPFWTVDTAYFTDIYPNTNARFFYYLCTTINFDLYKYGSAIPSMNQEVLNQIEFTSPSLAEQTAIANYLDHKTAQIDSIIANKQKLIDLYEEEKQTIINQAVTKGLKNEIPLKPTGNDWLGDIPEHWVVKKLSYCFKKIGSGTTPTSGKPEYYNDGEFNWLQTGDLTDGDIIETSKKITQQALNDFSSLPFYDEDSIVIAMYGATIGKLGLLRIKTCTNQACCVLSNSKNALSKYIFYWLLINRKHIISLAYGGGQPNINQELIKNLKVQLPPVQEQGEIIRHIEKECSRLDTLIDKFKTQIDLFQEYRSTLISEVVTGKVKVIE